MQNQTMQSTPVFEHEDGVFKTLDELYHQSRHIIARNSVTLDDARKLSEYVSNVRTLLTELEFIEGKIKRSDRVIASIHDLRRRYWELEGMVKEARNNLDRQQVAR